VLLDAGYPLLALKGIPILARAAGLIAHLLEEQQGRSDSCSRSGSRGGLVRRAAPAVSGRAMKLTATRANAAVLNGTRSWIWHIIHRTLRGDDAG